MKIQIQRKPDDDNDLMNFTFFNNVFTNKRIEEETHRRARSYQLSLFHSKVNNSTIPELLQTSNFNLNSQDFNDKSMQFTKTIAHTRQNSNGNGEQQPNFIAYLNETMHNPQRIVAEKKSQEKIKRSIYRFTKEKILTSNVINYTQIKDELPPIDSQQTTTEDDHPQIPLSKSVNDQGFSKSRRNFFHSRLNYIVKNKQAMKERQNTSELPQRKRMNRNHSQYLVKSAFNQTPPKAIKFKVVAKPVITSSKLPKDFLLTKKLNKIKSEERFVLNDLIDYTNFKNKGHFQGQQYANEQDLQFKAKVADIIKRNYLNENDPDLYQSLVIQNHQDDELSHQPVLQQSKFESSQKFTQKLQRETHNSTRTSFFDVQQIKMIGSQERTDEEMRETFYHIQEEMKNKRIAYTQRDYIEDKQKDRQNVAYEKEKLELEISNVHVTMRKEHKERIKLFLKQHNQNLSQIKGQKKEIDDIEFRKNNSSDIDHFLMLVIQGNCQEVYERVMKNPQLTQSKDSDLNTGLHLAVMHQNYDMVELLIFLGVDIYQKNNRRKDAESIAKQEENEPIWNLLKMKKHKISVKFNMWKIREYNRIASLRKRIKDQKRLISQQYLQQLQQ